MDSEFTENYLIRSRESEAKEGNEQLVTIVFLIAIFTVFLLTILFFLLITFLKPQLIRLNIYQDPMPKMADCSCLNICLPCNSCSFRQLLNGCCPRLNLKQRFNCFTTCCSREGHDKLNLVCCVV